jgi:hypothetical protein
MGEGEFTLAKADDFHMTACSADVSEGRTNNMKLSWNRDFAVKQEYPAGSGTFVTIVMQGGKAQDYTLTVTKGTAATPVDVVAPINFGVHANEGTWGCDSAAKGHKCRAIVKNEDVEIFLARRKTKGVWATKGHRVVIKFPLTGRMIVATIASKSSKFAKFGKRTLFNLMVKVPDDKTSYSGFCSETKASIKTKGFIGFTANQIATCTAKDDVADVKAELVDDILKKFVDPDIAVPCEWAPSVPIDPDPYIHSLTRFCRFFFPSLLDNHQVPPM